MDTEDQDLARVKHHVNALAEHFDSVQIFVTRHEAGTQDGTINAQYGAGNWFTRYGQVKQWVVRQEEHERVSVRKDTDAPLD